MVKKILLIFTLAFLLISPLARAQNLEEVQKQIAELSAKLSELNKQKNTLNNQIKIFDTKGKLKGQFFAYDQKFSGGVNLAVGDVMGDFRAEIVTVPMSLGGSHVKVFDGQGILQSHFFAYESRFVGGANVKIGNVYGKSSKGKNEIVLAPGPGRDPEIKTFDAYGTQLRGFLAYAEKFKNGVNLAIGDINKDGLDEIITGAGPGGAPHVRAFTGKGELKESFYGLEANFTGGVSVGFVELNN